MMGRIGAVPLTGQGFRFPDTDPWEIARLLYEPPGGTPYTPLGGRSPEFGKLWNCFGGVGGK